MKSSDSEARPDPARVEEVFHAAADLAEAEQTAFLARACVGDGHLEAAVRELLAASRHAATAWDRNAVDLEARHSAADSRPAGPGARFGPYRIVRHVAAGGMSFVYEAVRDDAEFHKRVAIKFVQQHLDAAGAVEQFRGERQILARLEHPNIARLLDGGTTDEGIPYLVMDYVDGVPIDRFAAERRLWRNDRLKLFLQVCAAVQYAHRNLVVHRDLKPGNILVTPDGVPKLLDFGIAKLLSSDSRSPTTTVRALTPEYASPEQVLGQSVGTATDVYSLGVLLFVLLADRLPYRVDATQPADLVRAICEEEPAWQPAGLIQGDLQSILAQALRKEPERRYLSVEQLAADVRRYMEHLPVSARPDAFMYHARKFVTRRAVSLAAGGAIIAAVVAGTISTIAQSRRAERRFNEVRSLAHSFLFEVYDSISALPGSLATRRLVAARAQEYLDSLAREAGNDSNLTRDLAASYIRLGDVRGRPYAANLGDTAGALESYRKAQALLERDAAGHPDDPAVQEPLCQGYLAIGRVLTREGSADAALEIFSKAIRIAERLSSRYPSERLYREELARAYLYLGAAQGGVARHEGSVSAYQTTLDTYRRSLDIQLADGPHADEPGQRDLATTYFFLGYGLLELGDRVGDRSYYRQALENQLKGTEIWNATAAAHPEHDYRRDLADALSTVGWGRWKSEGDLAGAMRDSQQSLKILQGIADADPNNLEIRRDVADVRLNMGLTLAEAGRRDQALEALRNALAIYEKTGRADPSSQENADKIALVHTRISELERRR